MRFTLTYEGVLPPRSSATLKQQIREALSPQLEELWTHYPLSDHRRFLTLPDPEKSGAGHVLVEVGGHVYAPLVTRELSMVAELDILMLRPELPGGIVIGGGDIDNRLKTLFDALRAPVSVQEVKDGARVTSVDQPMFVLLSDDDLITRVNVETDRLLASPNTDYVQLIIRVDAHPSRKTLGNIGL